MGTGSPFFFQCWKCRRSDWRNAYRRRRGLLQRVRLTGRTRKRKHAYGGHRSTLTDRQYECLDCGHVGWSNHVDLERKESE